MKKEQMLEVSISTRLLPIFKNCWDLFAKVDVAQMAKPLGADGAACQLAATVGKRLQFGQACQLSGLELSALRLILTLVERELAGELQLGLQDLQRKMVKIATSRNQKVIAQEILDLPKMAEKAVKQIRHTLHQKGELIDECELLMKKINQHLSQQGEVDG